MTTINMPDTAAYWQSLKVTPVRALVWLKLAQHYTKLDLPWQAGYAARQALRCDPSIRQDLDALNIGFWQDATAGDSRLGRASLSEATALAARFFDVVQSSPGDWLTWLYLTRLGDLLNEGGDLPYPDSLAHAQALEPIAGESLHWLGVWRFNAGDAEGAIKALSGLLELRPLRYGSMMYLAEALLQVGNIEAAEKAFSRASLSSNPDFLLTLSAKVYGYNYWQEAISVLQKALDLRPNHVATWLALAKIQSEVYDLTGCRNSLARIKALAPNNHEAVLLEAGLQGRMGDAKGHLSILQKAYEADKDPSSRLASSVAMTSLYHDTLTADEVAALHRRLCVPIETAVVPKTAFANPLEAGRRLRIGYVTGDLHRQHPVNIFLLPVLLRHDHHRFEISVYHTGTMHDHYTRQAKACADRWRECANLDDAALQQVIVDDCVDVLVDLAGHTASHRLGIFALRAAPVQATFLGYPYSTGLSAMDWLIGDASVTPTLHASLYSEGLAQLPHSVFCWAPVDDYPLSLPRPANTPLAFGSFNNAMKLSPKTVALWANVLQAVPDSMLLLKAPSLKDESVRARFAHMFNEHDVDPERLIFRGPSGLADMMQEYGDIDIALDPTPYNGGTTTLQALWMGVPVVCLAGSNFVGRMGASFLTTLARTDWLSEDGADYVANASRLAAQRDFWRANRSLLRSEMANSPLCDIETYTTHLENLYQRMWQVYCDGSDQRLINLF